MFSKVLIANRGAIACRIIRTLGRMGVGSVAVYSEADAHSLHVSSADEAVCIGPPPVAQSYLSLERIFEAARKSRAEAIHPGYGFLSENADFAEACAREGFVFIGPSPEHIRAFGLKHTARELAKACNLPLLPGTGLLSSFADAVKQARRIGFPVMLKSSAGGGGIGMRLCRSEAEIEEAFAAVERLGKANFQQAGTYLERFVERARHIEVQIFGDGSGNVIAIGERDCSAQRRNQKVIEETPAPNLPESVRQQMCEAAVRLGRSVAYRSAGTVEFIYDSDDHRFYFLEVNTRLQVEHGVTEEVTGVDLVEWMVREAAGELGSLETLRPVSRGVSLQVRIYAEDAAKNFQPSAGVLTEAVFPTDVRCETWVEAGTEITPFYDPLVAKIIVHGDDRSQALAKMREALAETRLSGIETNLDYLRMVVADPEFEAGAFPTSFLQRFVYKPWAIEVLEPGTQTTVQDFPGRLGYWDVGVPPSGPMDSLAFRLANRLVGNEESAAGLEFTMTGPSLRFLVPATIALTGASMGATLDGKPIPLWEAVDVPAGSVLTMGAFEGAGSRGYLAVRGGFDVPSYLGSRSTFILGRFGGHAGRPLRAGDILRLTPKPASTPSKASLPDQAKPQYGTEWEIGVLYGPHGAPDFFTALDIDMFFSTAWRVHYNSDRTGVRLLGPKPSWARKDGGEAGLHPSNIHDNAYGVGSIDFTGDMPVILGPDGPSLGGFVCPAVIVNAELWKVGQLRPGDTVRFRRLTLAQALAMDRAIEETISTLTTPLPQLPDNEICKEPAILEQCAGWEHAPAIVVRASGDRYLLIEYGPPVLDLNLRLRAHALMEWFRAAQLPGIIDLTPGIRSLQIHYDSSLLRREELIEALHAAEKSLPDIDEMTVPTRTVHLPLSWDDPATQLAIRKYMQSVRPDAPWCPSNIEFIRRINGLSSVDEVRRIVFDASYLVLGLGDVYLGAPVATPVDPRHRLVTTKYNPARTWTPENAVGIGGAYLCVYGMEGPGGYQFVGRTVQMWNTYKTTRDFRPGSPWLLRFFDQIRFYPVSSEELLRLRQEFPRGQYQLQIEEGTFRLREYHSFLESIRAEADAFKRKQQAAFEEERERWAAAGQAEHMADPSLQAPPPPPTNGAIPEGCHGIRAPITASVWNIHVEPGQRVEAGQKLLVIEAMKMEMAITSPHAGEVVEMRCSTGSMVTAGQTLAVVRVAGAAS